MLKKADGSGVALASAPGCPHVCSPLARVERRFVQLSREVPRSKIASSSSTNRVARLQKQDVRTIIISSGIPFGIEGRVWLASDYWGCEVRQTLGPKNDAKTISSWRTISPPRPLPLLSPSSSLRISSIITLPLRLKAPWFVQLWSSTLRVLLRRGSS